MFEYDLNNRTVSYTVWRDTPKRGETDAQWCFSISINGHVVHTAVNYASKKEAEAAADYYLYTA